MIVIYSLVLNHHQAQVSDELWKLTNGGFYFVELSGEVDYNKGGPNDFSSRPYLIRSWENSEQFEVAMNLALTADVCVFGGIDALVFQKARMKKGLMSFEMGERWFKKGVINLLSPRLLRFLFAYYFGGWNTKPMYKLCASAYAPMDQYRLGTYKGKCYKWGYFTDVSEGFANNSKSFPVGREEVSIMWCSRFISWKHPELPVYLASLLKKHGYCFRIDMYGDGREQLDISRLIQKLCVDDVVNLCGCAPNDEILNQMRCHDIFLFTSDQNEGWGAVANEAMSCGCVLVASDRIGSIPYLVKDGKNGVIFKSNSIKSLFKKVCTLFDDPELREEISKNGRDTMCNIWSPHVAATRLIELINCLKQGDDTPFLDGPCSRALPKEYA